MTRSEIRQRALRAAARVAFTVGAMGPVALGAGAGCIEPLPEEGLAALDAGASESDAAARLPQPRPEPARLADGIAVDGTPLDDAGTADDAAVADGASPGDAAVADASADAAVGCSRADIEDWTACCAAHDWNWEVPGCAAWGPPVPPALRGAVLRPGRLA